MSGPFYGNQFGSAAPAYGAAFDEGLRKHMLRVYNFMMLGLAVTGMVALFVASTPALYVPIFTTPLKKPNSGREMPFITRSSISAKGRAAMVMPNRLIGASFTPRSWAITPSWATAIRPPETVQMNMTIMTQKTGVCSASFSV
ncbi:hypothetical protein [Azospirillum brasilense]|uniref:hypothetical protein n=1 Tax=Azospirillum brasilense TaxID=192 RepID=UPI001FE2F6DD|nr:hypothetical protein [Azospirillum brasilense]